MKLTYTQTKIINVVLGVIMLIPLSVWLGYELGVRNWRMAAALFVIKGIVVAIDKWNWYMSMEKLGERSEAERCGGCHEGDEV